MEAVVQHVTVEVQWRAFVFTWLGTLADEAEDVITAILKRHLMMLGEAPPGREAVPVKYRQAAFEREYCLWGRGTHGNAEGPRVLVDKRVGRMLVELG
jgi:hypothetical protein